MVVSVEYRLAPEHKYPAQLEDTTDALEWLLENGGEHGIDTRRVAVAGESAGGHLTIVTGACMHVCVRVGGFMLVDLTCFGSWC